MPRCGNPARQLHIRKMFANSWLLLENLYPLVKHENKKECSSFLDNRNDGSEYHGEQCVASKRQIGFKSGNDCEPAIWAAKNQPRGAL